MGVFAAPPVGSIVDRITRSERLGTACARLFAGEGEVHFQRLLIGGGHQGALSETAETLRILATVQVAFALFPAQNPTAAGHLESLGDPFSCFAFSGDSSHRAGTVSGKSGIATDFRARNAETQKPPQSPWRRPRGRDSGRRAAASGAPGGESAVVRHHWGVRVLRRDAVSPGHNSGLVERRRWFPKFASNHRTEPRCGKVFGSAGNPPNRATAGGEASGSSPGEIPFRRTRQAHVTLLPHVDNVARHDLRPLRAGW